MSCMASDRTQPHPLCRFLRNLWQGDPLAILAAAGLLFLLGGGFFAVSLWGFAKTSNRYNQLKTITLGLHQYHDEHGCFPPAVTYGPDGRPWHSWRTLVLPYCGLEGWPRGYRFDEPWDSEHNRRFAEEHHAWHCGNDPSTDPSTASFLAVVGDRTMWPPHGTATRYDAKDGANRTALFVEVFDSGVLWTEPRDLHFDEMTFAVGATDGRGIRGAGDHAHIALVDSSVGSVSSEDPPELIRSILLRDDGGPENWEGL